MTSSVQLLLFAAGVACLSTVLTAAVLALLVRLWIGPRFRAHIDEASDIVAAKVRVAVSESGQQLLPQFKSSVRAGFSQSADEVLPRFRAAVTGGFQDAVVEALPRFRA